MDKITGGSAVYRKILLLTVLGLFSAGCAAIGPASTPQAPELIVKVRAGESEETEIKDDQGITRSMEVPNEEGHLSELSFISKDKAFIKIFSELSVSDVTRLWNDIVVLELNSDIRDINLFINSPGGDAFSGLALADEIDNRTAHILTSLACKRVLGRIEKQGRFLLIRFVRPPVEAVGHTSLNLYPQLYGHGNDRIRPLKLPKVLFFSHPECPFMSPSFFNCSDDAL